MLELFMLSSHPALSEFIVIPSERVAYSRRLLEDYEDVTDRIVVVISISASSFHVVYEHYAHLLLTPGWCLAVN